MPPRPDTTDIDQLRRELTASLAAQRTELLEAMESQRRERTEDTRRLYERLDALTKPLESLCAVCRLRGETVEKHELFINGNGDVKQGAKSRLDRIERAVETLHRWKWALIPALLFALCEGAMWLWLRNAQASTSTQPTASSRENR